METRSQLELSGRNQTKPEHVPAATSLLDSLPESGLLVCPRCEGPLTRERSELQCTACERPYAINADVASFCDTQVFYESYLEEHCPFVVDPPRWKQLILRVLPFWSWREWRFFRSHIPRGARVLDLGCARGKEWFSGRASFIAGIDPIIAPLHECATHYDVVAQAEVTALPFKSGSFDCVVTSHVLGHIAPQDKDAAWAEIARVLRPGGVSVNIIETDSRNGFVELGKSDPDLYRANFIETDGHIGLELPSEVVERFEKHGFRIQRLRKMESGLVHLRYYGKYLGKGYPERVPLVRRRISRWNRIARNPVLLGVYEVLMGLNYQFVEPRTTPRDNAMFIALSAEKLRPSSQP